MLRLRRLVGSVALFGALFATALYAETTPGYSALTVPAESKADSTAAINDPNRVQERIQELKQELKNRMDALTAPAEGDSNPSNLSSIVAAINRVESGFGSDKAKTLNDQSTWKDSIFAKTDDVEKKIANFQMIVDRGYWKPDDLGVAGDIGSLVPGSTTGGQVDIFRIPKSGDVAKSYSERLIAGFFINPPEGDALMKYLARQSSVPFPDKGQSKDDYNAKLARSVDVGDLSAFSLIGPDVYTTEQMQKQARNFMLIASDYPFLVRTLTRGYNQSDEKAIRETEEEMRARLALQSIGLDNLYSIFMRRLNQGTAEHADSLLNQQKTMVLRRLTSIEDPDLGNKKDRSWKYQLLGVTSSVQLQKEQLLALSEMQYQLMGLHAQLERMLLLLSVAQMQGLRKDESVAKMAPSPEENRQRETQTQDSSNKMKSLMEGKT